MYSTTNTHVSFELLFLRAHIRDQSYESKDPNFMPASVCLRLKTQNKYYQGLKCKKPLRSENYAVVVRTTTASLWRENYASSFRGIKV